MMRTMKLKTAEESNEFLDSLEWKTKKQCEANLKILAKNGFNILYGGQEEWPRGSGAKYDSWSIWIKLPDVSGKITESAANPLIPISLGVCAPHFQILQRS